MVPGNMGKSFPLLCYTFTCPGCPPFSSSWQDGRIGGVGKSRKTQPHCFSHLPTSCPSIQPLLCFQISALLLSFAPLPPMGLPPSLIPGPVGSHSSASSGPFPGPSHLGRWSSSCFRTACVQQAPHLLFQGSHGADEFLGQPGGGLILFVI